MRLSFQTSPEFLQAITIPARRRVRRHIKQLPDFFKCTLMPKFQHNHLALRHGQLCQTPHCGAFRRRFLARPFEPALRFKFPCHPPPERSPVIQRAIPKAPYAVMLRLLRRFLQREQRYKSLLHHVFRLGMGQSQRATIQDQFARFGLIKPFAPRRCRSVIHSPHRHHTRRICIKKLDMFCGKPRTENFMRAKTRFLNPKERRVT